MSSLRQQLQHTQWTLDRTREAADKSQRLADQLEEDNRRLQQALMDTQADLALLEVRVEWGVRIYTVVRHGPSLVRPLPHQALPRQLVNTECTLVDVLSVFVGHGV